MRIDPSANVAPVESAAQRRQPCAVWLRAACRITGIPQVYSLDKPMAFASFCETVLSALTKITARRSAKFPAWTIQTIALAQDAGCRQRGVTAVTGGSNIAINDNQTCTYRVGGEDLRYL